LFSLFVFGNAAAQFNSMRGKDASYVAYHIENALCAVSSDDNMIYTYQLNSTFSELYGFSLSPISTTPPSFRATLPTNHNGNCATAGNVAVRIDRGQI